MTDTTPGPVQELVLIVSNVEALVPVSGIQQLIDTIRPIADRLAKYKADAGTLKIATDADAEHAAALREQMLEDMETAVGSINDTLPIEQLFQTHRKLTGFRGLFAEIATYAKLVKSKIGDYEAEKAAIAEKERARLQAIEDEKARKEQERLIKLADSRKTPELQEKYREQAAQVVAPVVHVEVTKTGTKFQTRWAVKSVDMTAMGIPVAVQGFITVEEGRLARGKAANSMLMVPGIEFHQVRV